MAYYAETNLIAILVAAVLLFVNRSSSFKSETGQIIMSYMLSLLIVVSVSDMAAYYFRGQSYLGVQLSNVLYLEAMALGTYAWFLFVVVKLGYAKNLRRAIMQTGIPAILLCIAIATNPLTNYFFTVDDQLLYHRGPGVIWTWIVEWGYLFAALSVNIRTVLKEKSPYRKQEYRGYLLFAMPMAIAAIAQMLVYGITTLQIGYMVALLLVFLNTQYYQVHRDGLTGLSNKNAFLNFQDSELSRQSAHVFTVFMADMDRFKQINDTYGHLTGDRALHDAADVLKSATKDVAHSRLLLFRYGGDEFAIIGRDMAEDEITLFEQAIQMHITQKNIENREHGKKYQLSMSIGHATGECHDGSDLDKLVKQADETMYGIKRAKKS